MKESSTITKNEITSKLDIISDGFKYNIAKFSSLGIIKRKGITKAGK